MVERMKNSFVTRDNNQSVSWNSESMANEMIGLGDGTTLSPIAFGKGTPMSEFTPAELGIDMSAYPGGAPQSVSEREAAQIESSQNPFELPLQQDLQTGGVQFQADGSIGKANNFLKNNSYTILIGGLFFTAGWFLKGLGRKK